MERRADASQRERIESGGSSNMDVSMEGLRSSEALEAWSGDTVLILSFCESEPCYSHNSVILYLTGAHVQCYKLLCLF